MNIGIVGHEAAKFTKETEQEARSIICGLLLPVDAVLVSGHCHLGGIDIWAEEEANSLGRSKIIFAPKVNSWQYGYKPRNIDIAITSDIVYSIVISSLPPEYRGMRFSSCYHCKTSDHVKSGGCWTAHYAKKLGKPAIWHIIK